MSKDKRMKMRARHLQKVFGTLSYTQARDIANDLVEETRALALAQEIDPMVALEQLAAKVLARKAGAQ